MKKVDATSKPGVGGGVGCERTPRPSPSSNIANSAAASGNIAAELEQVRLPGIINMDLEATKIRTGDEVSAAILPIFFGNFACIFLAKGDPRLSFFT